MEKLLEHFFNRLFIPNSTISFLQQPSLRCTRGKLFNQTTGKQFIDLNKIYQNFLFYVCMDAITLPKGCASYHDTTTYYVTCG